MPSQKKSLAEKVKNDYQWAKDCLDAGHAMILFQNQGLRQNRINKKVNYDLYSGVVDINDMERTCNPHRMTGTSFPSNIKHYPLINPKVNILRGEEVKRRFDWKVVVINPDAISEKQEEQKKMFVEFINEQIQKENYSEEEAAKELEKLQQYLKYEFKGLQELKATRLLNYYTKYLDLKTLFNKGIEDAIIAGEEIYCVDEMNGEPTVRRCNPLNTYYLTYPDSYYIEDCDMILEEGYVPIGDVIDDYYDELTKEDIELLERRDGQISNRDVPGINYANPITFTDPTLQYQGLIDTTQIGLGSIGGSFDVHGNVRKVRLVWRSLRKIGILTYFDEDGNQQERDVDESYIADKNAGETIRYIWIGEWWEGTRLANKIYVKIKPRSIQFRKLENKSYCASGYVGSIYNTNSNRVQSLFDMLKPYNYQYDAYMYRTEMAFIKAKGKIGELDIANIPDGWDVDQWMYYAEILGWAVKDSFKEGKKGAATGKLVGTNTPGSNVMNLELGNYIQQHIQMLQYIENQMDKISGVSEQRQGQVETSAGLGTTQQAVEASRTITEPLFSIHDNIKVRVLRTLLETAKYCLRGKSKKVQYILDDTTSILDEIEGDQINDAEFGVMVSNSASDTDLMKLLKDLAHAGMQNNLLSFTELIDIHTAESISQVRGKIKEAEDRRQQRAEEQSKSQQEHEQQLKQMEVENREDLQAFEMEIKQAQLEIDKYRIDTESSTKITIAEISALGYAENKDVNANMIPDVTEVAAQALKEREHYSSMTMKQLELENKRRETDKKVEVEREKIKASKEIENKKLQQIESQNKNQIELANKKAKLDEKMMNNKLKLETMKAKLAAKKSKTK